MNWINQAGTDVSPLQQNTQMEHPAPLEWALTAPCQGLAETGGCQDLQELGCPFSLAFPQHPLVHSSLLVLCTTHLQTPRQGLRNPPCETQQETEFLTSPCINGGDRQWEQSDSPKTDCLARAVAGVSEKDLSSSGARDHPSSFGQSCFTQWRLQPQRGLAAVTHKRSSTPRPPSLPSSGRALRDRRLLSDGLLL